MISRRPIRPGRNLDYNFVVLRIIALMMLVVLAGCAGEPVTPTPNVPATVEALRAAQLQRSTAQIGILPTTPTITPVVTPTDIPSLTPEPTLEPTPTEVIATAVSPQEAAFQKSVTTWMDTLYTGRLELGALITATDAGSDSWLKRFDTTVAKIDAGIKLTTDMKAPDQVKASETMAKSQALCVQTEMTKLKKARPDLKPGKVDPLKQAVAGILTCTQTGTGK